MQDVDEVEREKFVAASPFGIHEALHTCSVLMDTFGSRVAEHPAVSLRPEIAALADKAMEAMMDVYQALGALPEWSEDEAADEITALRAALESVRAMTAELSANMPAIRLVEAYDEIAHVTRQALNTRGG